MIATADPPETFSPKELAAEVGVHVDTIRRMLKRGTIKADQPGGKNHGITIPIREAKRCYPTVFGDVGG